MHKLVLLVLLLLSGCTTSGNNDIANGVLEIVIIAYQPGEHVANQVANTKDRVDSSIRSAGGNSRVGQAISSQVVPAARQAIGNSSGTILRSATGGIIDPDNIDHR